jgi:hypothetical protein
MNKFSSVLWLAIKIAFLTLMMDAGRVAFVYQNF